jgi:tripeptidyl-peptidase-1
MLVPHLSSLLLCTLVADVTVARSLRIEHKLSKRAVPESHRLHERQAEQLASTWVKRDKVPPNVILPMRIGVKQDNLDQGHNKLMDM